MQAWFESVGKGVCLFESQAFEREAWPRESLRDAVFGFIVGQHNDFHTCSQQRRDDVALQEVDDGHAVVGGDEDFFGH